MMAVQGGPSPNVARAAALVEAGRTQEAVRLLESSAAANDPEALYTLAMCRVSGQLLPRDLQAAKQLFGRAAAAGDAESAQIHVAFVTHGAGGDADWAKGVEMLEDLAGSDETARRQLALIHKMALTDGGDPLSVPQAERLSQSPEVHCVRALFTQDECAFLIEAAVPRLQRALVTDRATGRLVQTQVRTADTAPFPLIAENPAVHALNRRMAAASGTTVEQGEPLQVLRYTPGQEYRAHFDALAAGSNQRVLTMLVYLNEGYEGGETAFLQTGLKFKGRTGDALLFRNASADGQPDPMSQHAGLPVTRGTKMIASRWIRARPIDLSRPLT